MNFLAIPDDYYGSATARVRAVYNRVARLRPEEMFSAPRGDRDFAAECVARWLAMMGDLINGGRAEHIFEDAADPETAAGDLHFYRWKYSRGDFPTSLRIEWAEGPWELLLPPDPPADPEDGEPWGVYRKITWSEDRRVERLCDLLLMSRPDLQALVKPPVWSDIRRDHLSPILPPIPPFRPQGRSGRAFAALNGLSNVIRAAAQDVLNLAFFEPLFGANPYEYELDMFERGLVPLGADDDSYYVFRYSPDPVSTPSWLPRIACTHP